MGSSCPQVTGALSLLVPAPRALCLPFSPVPPCFGPALPESGCAPWLCTVSCREVSVVGPCQQCGDSEGGWSRRSQGAPKWREGLSYLGCMGCRLAPSEIPPLPCLSSFLLVLFCTNICHQGSGWGRWGHHRCEACVSISACLARASAHVPLSCPSRSHIGVSSLQNVCASRVGIVQGCGGRVETVRSREGDRLGSFIHPTVKDWIRGDYLRPSRLCSGAWEQSSRQVTVLGTLWGRRH